MRSYTRTRYVGGPKLDDASTADRARMLRERLAQLRETEPATTNIYDFDDSERYDD
jgi:hypothetical protein